ncbi:hypothetical protein BSLG_002959 [Batrachochytrium salamandrivorans]|nr:hypothetical protein BSLG_002959 [Batrachochytrium salamandrivorans]
MDNRPLPPGWVSQWNTQYSRHYYYDTNKGVSSWEDPRGPPPPVSAPPPPAGGAPPPAGAPPPPYDQRDINQPPPQPGYAQQPQPPFQYGQQQPMQPQPPFQYGQQQPMQPQPPYQYGQPPMQMQPPPMVTSVAPQAPPQKGLFGFGKPSGSGGGAGAGTALAAGGAAGLLTGALAGRLFSGGGGLLAVVVIMAMAVAEAITRATMTLSSHNIVSAALLRSLNKSANAIQFVFLGEGEYVDVDQTLAGMTLAVSQINSNSSILQDVTIELVSYSMPMGTTSPAATFEFGYLLCQSKNHFLWDPIHIAISFSALAGGDLLSNKEFASSALRLFRWTSIGMVSSQNFEYLGALCKQYFPDHGVNIDAWTVFPEYDPNVSLLYYPQIQTEFKFLKYTNLRVFLAHVDGTQIMDVMMAANQTGLCGPEYVWTTSQSDLSVEPGSEHRWDTPLYPDLLRGVSIVNNPVGPSVNSTYLKEFMPDFLKFANSTAANNTDMYMFMDATEIDPTSQAYPLSYLFSNPGKDTIPANPVCSGYDGAWTLAHVCEKAIVNSGMTGAELANNSLSSTISLDLILSQAMAYSSLTEFSLFSQQEIRSPIRL